MPTTFKTKRHTNGVFYVHFTEGRRSREISLHVKDKEEVGVAFEIWLREYNRSVIEQDTPGSQTTVSDLWERYSTKDTASPASMASSWKNLQPFFGPMTASAVTQDRVDEYEAERTAGTIGRVAKSSTVRRELAMLRACLNWCAHPKRRLLDPTLIQHFDLPAEGAPRDRWLKTEEIERLLKAAARIREDGRLSRVERFLWLAIETGARKTALLELTWDRVDFETKVIHLNVPGRKTTKKRRADVPISKALLPVLERAYDERDGDLVLDNKAELWASVQRVACAAGFGSDEPRFVIRKGEKRYLKRRATGISPHVLRHTAATHMARRGVPLWIVAKVLANSLPMIEKVYAKHAPDDLRSAVDLISGK